MKLFKKTGLIFLSALAITLCGCKETPATPTKPTITINPSSLEIFEDDQALVTAETTSLKPISYSSADTNIVSVNSSGILIAKAVGVTTIKASVEDVFDTCTVTVKPISEKVEDYIAFKKSSFVIGFNESDENIIEPTYYHEKEPVQDKNFTYTSLDESVATVNQDGKISIIGSGVASIVVSADEVYNTVFVDVYDIVMKTAADWMSMLATTKNRKARFYLNNDIDFEGVEYSTPSRYDNILMGEVKGNYHTLTNITMKPSAERQSIFGYASAFTLTNIRFTHVTYTSSYRNTGLFVCIYEHVTEKDGSGNNVNNVYPSTVSNVLCDFVYTSVMSSLIADSFYGCGVENLYVHVSNAEGKEFKESTLYATAFNFYNWYGSSYIVNMVVYLDSGKITVEPKKLDPSDTGFWLDLKKCIIDTTTSLIEANFLASKNYDPNIWMIKPNELPTFVE